MLKEIAMKKILLITVVTSLIGVTGCSNKTIAEDKAKKIALNDAEVSEANITFTIQGKDQNGYHYLFEDDNYTYEYEIDIHDGTIENKEILVKEFSPLNDYDKIISSDEAKTISLNYFSFTESDISNLNIELDNDSSNIYYNISFTKDKHHYSINIEAVNGIPTNAKTTKSS